MTNLVAIVALCSLAACKQGPQTQDSTDPRPSTATAQAIRDKLQATQHLPLLRVAGSLDRSLLSFYAARDYRPLWNDPAALRALMRGGFDSLASDGLTPAHYLVDDWVERQHQAYANPADAKARADFDLLVSRSYLRAMLHVAFGKVDPQKTDADWDTAPVALQERLPLSWAGIAAETGAAGGALAQARPGAALYTQLRAALAAAPAGAETSKLRVNLERARWLLHDLPPVGILVDVTGYQLRYQRASGEVWRSKVVVGKPYRETPMLRSDIDRLVFNPTWTVPPTIFAKDIAPKARVNAAATLEKKHLRAIDGQGREVPLKSIDWSDPKSVILRQDPGPENPLGQVKLQFPNSYQVYLHDTPSQHGFASDDRANSSGCIRVEHALELAQKLIEDAGAEPAGDAQSQVSSGETREVRLLKPVPVILYYATAALDENGQVAYRDDIYDRDPALLQALDRR